jgi:3-hydroxyacyl-CoA dehydrogenase
MRTTVIKNIAVIGLGTIGHSVAQVYASAGLSSKML